MSASASIFTGNSLLVSMASANSAEANAPDNEGESSSFEDVWQQQGGEPSNSVPTKANTPGVTDKPSTPPTASSATTSSGETETPDAPASTAPGAKTAPLANASAKSSFTALPPGSDLAAMIVQASVLASSARPTLAAKIPAATIPTEPGNDSGAGTGSAKNPSQLASGGADLTTLITQASILVSTAQQTLAAKTPSGPATTSPAKSGNDSSAGTASAQNQSGVIAGALDLSTLIAQASMAAANGPQTSVANAASGSIANASVGLGTQLPLSGLSTGSPGSAVKEKKSASASVEGSFLQSDTTSSYNGSSVLGLPSSSLTGISELSVGQQLASIGGSTNLSFNDLSGGALSIAGTANVEKGKAMNDDLNFSDVELLSGYGATATTGQSPADLHIQLGSNNDFTDALKQVMHVAALTQTNESRAPMRVAMEIQTPPGAIVNVYVSRQNDQWRAQLSTNDPQALSWVQNQMSSLRQSSNLGVEVKWLPPQMESSPTTSSGQDANLSWDRGGQGQANYQQPDERQQSGRQKKAGAVPALAAIPSNQFMNTLTALGRAA